MRISRRTRKEEPKKIYFHNEGISAPQVLVLDSDGAKRGIMPTAQAVRLAREQEMDLVVINPKSDPPVAKILDFGQFRYNLEKEERIRKAHQHVIDIKGVRLSLRIGKHDLDIRKTQAIKFLDQGDKIKIEIMLRGREFQQMPMAFEVVKNFIASVQQERPLRVEQTPERQANKITAIVAKA